MQHQFFYSDFCLLTPETCVSLKECSHGKVELAAAFVVFRFAVKVKAHLKSQGAKGGLPANAKARALSHIGEVGLSRPVGITRIKKEDPANARFL